MLVHDLMTRDVITVQPDTPLKTVARLLVEHRIGGVPVVDASGVVLGVVSESDFALKELGAEGSHQSRLARLLGRPNRDAERLLATTAGEAMTRPAVTVEEDTASVREATTLMIRRNINRLPVVNQGRLVGILTRGDVVRIFTQADEAILDRVQHELRAVDGLSVSVEDGIVTLTGSMATRVMADVAVHVAERTAGVLAVNHEGLSWREEPEREPLLPR